MKRLIALVFIVALIANASADVAAFKPLSAAPKSDTEEFFKVTDGEAKVEGHIINLFVVKPEYLTVSYKNKGKSPLSPSYSVSTYNRYGYLLGNGAVIADPFQSGGLDVGDVGSDKIELNLSDLAPILKHVVRDLPADFFDVAWVSLTKTNTKLAEQASTDQPATRPESKSEGSDKPQPEAEGRSR